MQAKTPHSASHYFNNTSPAKRAFEGWYFRLTLPQSDIKSLAIVHCVEDPNKRYSALSKVSSQVLWDDGYISQHSRNTRKFWSSDDVFLFGCSYTGSAWGPQASTVPLYKPTHTTQDQGFIATDVYHAGSLCFKKPDGDMLATTELTELVQLNATTSTASRVSWSYSVKPIYSWGDATVQNPASASQGNATALDRIKNKQNAKATTGWLAAIPLFDPQWQICYAHALATGWIEIDGKRTEFSNTPAYCEKNWGAGFPHQWFWMQCNSFNRYPDLTVTAVGATRRAVQPYGPFVDVGIIGIHFNNGQFIEIVPWNGGSMEWDVKEWGSWTMQGSNTKYEVLIEATTPLKDTGAALRGPHTDKGFIALCRDSFQGKMRLRIWKKPSVILNSTSSRSNSLLVLDASSETAAVEVGGEGWKGRWRSRCTIPELLATTLKEPVDVDKLKKDLF